jgi:uncharacterized protein (TIGR03083 family)
VDLVEIYATTRTRLLDLAPALSTDQLAAALPATPPWTVLDGYRHLAGVCADFLDGRLEGAGSPEWTAAQLTARAGAGVEEVCREWAGRAAEIDERIAGGGTGLAFLAFDAWTHGQDIRAAVGLPAQRNDELVPALAAIALQTFAPRYAKAAGPAITVAVDGTAHQLGDGEPEAVLDTNSYELLRIIFGRRSERQMSEAGWSCDCPKAIAAIHLFDPPASDLVD